MNFARKRLEAESRCNNDRNGTNTFGNMSSVRLFFHSNRASWCSPDPREDSPTNLHAREVADARQSAPVATGARQIVCDAALTPREMISLFEWGLERRVEIRVLAEALGNVAQFLPKSYRDGAFLVFGRSRANKAQRLAKRAVDVAVSLLGLVMLLPVFMVAAALICLESEGSPVFVQERVGFGGRSFRLLKFRSMFRNTTIAPHLAFMTLFVGDKSVPGKRDGIFKLVKRPEVTRVGRFLRRSSVDELPQLFNVLRGEMSLVGPRPVPVYEAKLYDEWHLRRHRVRPGMTGLWQVYARSRVPFNEMMLLDVIYAYNWSFALDVRLLLLTLPAVVRSSGAV